MKEIVKHIVVFMLSLCMVFTMMPFNVLNVAAEKAPADEQPVTEETTPEQGTEGDLKPLVDPYADEGLDGEVDSTDAESEEDLDADAEEGSEDSETDVDSDAEEPSEDGDIEETEELTDEETTEEETEPIDEESTADYVNNKGNEGADVSGPAAEDEEAAAEVLSDQTELTKKKAEKVATKLFAADADGDGKAGDGEEGDDEGDTTPPSSGDGTNIDVMTARWLTNDTVNNDDDNLLYVRPDKNSTSERVRLQVNYALSGEHRYDPGDITITLPANLFKTRTGQDADAIIVPYPESPSKKSDYNWRQEGDKIILTNTKMMSAATKGFFQIEFDGINPTQLKDMAVSDDFVATIEVSTHKGNILTLSTEPLTAQFDTEARLTDVQKRNLSVTRVKASQIPASQRVEGEEEYIKVDWYVWGSTNANTRYTIDQVDYIPQAEAVETRKVVADGAVADPNAQISLSEAQEKYASQFTRPIVVGDTVTIRTEADVNGFVLGGASADTSQIMKNNVYTGTRDGRGSDYSFSTVYPASQFQKDTNYKFHNKIRYTVTETDPEVTEHTNPNVNGGAPDPALKTTKEASATVTWSFTDPKWINPGGHYMINKNGNDDTARSNQTHRSTYTYSDLHRNDDGYYGIYPSAINELQDEYAKHGADGSVRLSYTINTRGWTLPWMYDGGYAEFREGELPARIIGNYNRPITMTTTDTGVSFGRNGAKLQVGVDYTYEEIEFPNEPYAYKGYPQNINPDGTWTALTAGDGTFKYIRDYDKSHWPDITLQIERNGQWEDYAVVSWKSGKRVIRLASGAVLTTTGVVKVPEDTQNFRTIVTTQNTVGGLDATEALQAGFEYDVRPVINLKSTKTLVDQFDGMFAQSHLPSMAVYNSANMLVEYADVSASSGEHEILSINREGYDSIRGYTTDTSVYPYKSATQKLREVDYENRQILIHYEARVEEHSVINDRKTWQEAVDEGRLISEKGECVWRDLLPKGVTPDVDSVKLRTGDRLIRAYTEENYQHSGRTMLVVIAELKPVPQTYRSGDMTYYMDVPTIKFDATYDFESWKDYGSNIHNVISFESGNDTLGTIPGYTGEPDDPKGTNGYNNVSTRYACINDEERTLMTDLDDSTNKPAFVYAGTTTNIDILAAARTSLYKDVQVNNDGYWSEGTYYEDIYGPPVEATEGGQMRTVYEGGQYTYRLRVMSDPETVSEGLVLYDALEDFHAVGNDNDSIDAEAIVAGATWQGTLREVDVSQLVAMGAKPVVYYSTKVHNYNEGDDSEYALTEGHNDVPNRNVIDLTKDHWVKAEDYDGPMSDIKAIAIDCRYADPKIAKPGNINKVQNEDGTYTYYFRLQPMQSAVVNVRMHAPYGDDAREILDKTGSWGDSAMTYNNAYLYAASFDEDDSQSGAHYEDGDDDRDFIRKDYTKVGMKEYSLSATKKWNDDDDRDGIRPDKITFRLYENGKPGERTKTMDIAAGETSVEFEHIPYTDKNGDKINYTIVEESIEGYRGDYSVTDGVFNYTNTHEPERINIPGEKTWEGDEEENRPASIDVQLYANGDLVKTLTVKPDADGNWKYEFTGMLKYYDKGKEIKYTVKEVKTPRTGDQLESYDPTYEEDGIDIKNTYHPFGQLKVSKTVEDTTAASRDKNFTFTFVFNEKRKGEDGEIEEAPIFDEFDYEILDADGNAVTDESGEPITGKIKTNEEITIKGGQTIHVKEIPQYILYKVTEESVDGFTLTGKSGDSGEIRPNATAEASFTNKYAASGQTNLEAKKILENRTLNKNQFIFELYQVVKDEEGNETLIPKPSASNGVPDPADESGDESTESTAPVTFGALRFTHEDDGKTFTYRMNEVDRSKPGYVYSKEVYEVDVTVKDNGDGTLTITKKYKDSEGNPVDVATFRNKYKATGNTQLLAWKDLPGRDLKDGEFTFELLDEHGAPIMNESDDGEKPVTATNKKDGTVTFSPADVQALNYTEKDIGKTYYYGISEIEGDDDTVHYDKTVYGYAVTIIDNDDGTLYAKQELAKPEFDKEDPTKIVGWTTEGAVLPNFKNTLEDGGLAIQKIVQNPDEAPTQEFKFRVVLTGDGIPEGETAYTITKAGDPQTGDSGSTGDDQNASGSKSSNAKAKLSAAAKADEGAALPATGKQALDDEAVSTPKKAGTGSSVTLKEAADESLIVDSRTGSYWGVGWRITTAGEMIFGQEGATQYFDNTQYPYTDYYAPWENYKSRVKSIRFEGNVIGRGSFWMMLSNFTNLETINFSGLDLSNVTSLFGMFGGDSKLKAVDMSNVNTSSVTNISSMFQDCSSLKTADLSGLNTSKVTDMSQLFYRCSALEETDISSFNTARTTNMSLMFSGTSKLNTVHLSPEFSFKNITLNTPPSNDEYSGKWIRDDYNYGPYTPSELAGNYSAQKAGTWIWDKNNKDYKVQFTADPPVAGSMQAVSCSDKADLKLPANQFLSHNSEFDHWVVVEKNGQAVENGKTYDDKATIPAGTYTRGDVVTLKAVMKPVETTVNIKDGEFEITLYGGEKAVFDKIPAGTTYQVYEETPTGWILIEQSNVSGSVEPKVTSVASFTNKYEPGATSVQLYGTKTLDKRAAKAGAFDFVLLEGEEELQRVSTISGGFIQFDPIVYREEGTHTYTIAEVDPEDETIDWDTHSETVTVVVTKDGEDLSAEVTYDDDGVKFVNTTKPGTLKLKKKAEGATDANDDVEFTFKIKLNNANGMPLGKDDKIYWFTEPNPEKSKIRSFMYRNFGIGEHKDSSVISDNAEADAAVQASGESNSQSGGEQPKSKVSLKAAAADDIASGTFRGADWRITSGGVLIIGNGGTQTLNGNGNKDNPSGWPWYSYRSRITSVKFDGTVNMTGSAAGMFKNMTNLTTFDSTGFNPSTANNFAHMFYGCRNLISVDAKGWVTSRVSAVDGMFMNCYALKKVVTSEWDVSSVITIYQLFENCNNLEEVDTSSWKTNKTDAFRWMNDIFSNCHKLKDVDTSGWVIVNTIEGWQWFNNDYKIRRLDLTGVARPVNRQYETDCFGNMNSLSVFKVGTKTFDNNVARFQPGTWKNVATGATYDGNWLNRNWKSNMAGTYVRLTATFYKNGEMIIDWGYDESRNAEVDEVFIIPNDTGGTPPWSSYAGKNNVTKVTINTDISPLSTANWFNGMSKLKTVNGLDHLKMTNLTNMQNMFQGCTSLESIYLPENFSFKGKNITSTSSQAVLPTPPTTNGFIGKWVREDDPDNQLTPAELRDQFGPAMAGVWVWAVDTNTAILTFNGNGGFPETERIKETVDTIGDGTAKMPDNKEFKRPHYILTGWNTKANGSGTNYEPGADVSGILQLGKNKTLYAQWETTDLSSYRVEHYQQKADMSGYTLVDTDRPDMVVAGTEVTPEVKTYAGFLSPEPQTVAVKDDDSTVVKYYYDRLTYHVSFDGNGATSGEMEDQTIQGGTMTELSKNQYKKEDSLFIGWNTEADGSGKYYANQQPVRDLTKTNGGTVTLYAQWLSKEDQELEPTNGEIIVKCKAGETIVLPDLPAGTTYTIEEIDVPDGWKQSGEITGNNEAIEATVTKYATATNVYSADGEAQLRAHKTLEGADIEEGQFTFELYNDADLTDLIETATNREVDNDANSTGGQSGSNPYYKTSLVEFTPIEYTEEDIGKTFTYYIRETGSVSGITLDENVYEATVAVEDAGSGMLTTTVTYKNVSEDGASATEQEPIFVNKMKPAKLVISKEITGPIDGVEDTEFTFTVELLDADGNALEGEYDAVIDDNEFKVEFGDTIDLKGGETVTISGLPHGASYKVTEAEVKNWEQIEATGTTGVLQAGETSEASFTNKYIPPDKYLATGSVQFTAKKEVVGGTILDEDDFTFELTDEEGNTQTKACDIVSTDEDSVTESTITFDKITYTLDDLEYTENDQNAIDQYVTQHMKTYQDQYDADKAAYDAEHADDDPPAQDYMDFNTWIKNKTGLTVNKLSDELTKDAESQFKKENDFIYYVREIPGDDSDIDYDPARYCYKVHAVDKGDGTIKTDVTKWKLGTKEDEVTHEMVADDTPVEDEITFTNTKFTQIKVYKRWVDNDDLDGVRPTKEEFASMIHLLKNGMPYEVSADQMKIAEDEEGNLTITYVKLPAYDEDGKITYTVQEEDIAGYTAKDGKTEVAGGETLMNVHTPGTTDLAIQKSLDGYYDGGAQSNITLAFKAEAKDKNGKVIFTGYAGLTFEKGDELTKTAVIKNVPEKATEIIVTEEYSSAYDTAKPVKAVYNESSGVWEVEIDNSPGGGPHEGSGIVNKYADGKYVEPGSEQDSGPADEN